MTPCIGLHRWTQIISVTSRSKSPMGMDLIPVYADDLSGGSDKAGTVSIDPSVENNLGVKTARLS
ncbi:hypothetical protein OK016_23950 [Vibrio chagasii]|nr:hypothetical protein [Vibrio chagasii]